MRVHAIGTTPARRTQPVFAASLGAILALTALVGCGTDEMEADMAQPAVKSGRPAAVVCATDARAVSLPASFPGKASLPAGYVVTGTEARSAGRTVVRAVSPKSFEQTLAEVRAAYSSRGWTLSEGEVEERDAESNFRGHGLRGRWAIREMPDCPGNTSVSVLIGR
jgi:hypothetical protein